MADAQHFIKAIGHRVALLLHRLPDRPHIVSGGLNDAPGSDLGQSLLATGRASDTQLTDVLYISGSNFFSTSRIIGVAFQSPEGSNLEQYGFVYPASFFNSDFRSGQAPDAIRRLFIIEVAAVIAHEYGHLLGLGHVFADPQHDMSLMNHSVPLYRAGFPNVTYVQTQLVSAAGQSVCGTQNPFMELVSSLNGSQTVYPGSNQWIYSAGGPVVIGTPACSTGGTAAGAIDDFRSSALGDFRMPSHKLTK